MAPRKKTSAMILARKSQQPAKPETEKMKSPLLQELPYSSNTVSNSQPTSKDHTLFKPDWSLLPEELLHLISEKLEDCFDVIHARSVCHSWRSIFPFPSCLLRESYSLPHYRRRSKRRSKGLCTLEKFPIFLLRVRPHPGVDDLPADFFVGGINQDKSEDHMELRSPFQCTVKVKIPVKIPGSESEQILLNVLDYQILPMGYQFKMVGWDPAPLEGVAFLPLDKERGKEFVVLLGYDDDLLVLRSSDMRWMRLDRISEDHCEDIVTLRGKFYVNFRNKELFVIDPYSLEATPLMPLDLGPLMPTEIRFSFNHLVPCGNDELFLVERIHFGKSDGTLTNASCRVCRLDENAGEWVVVTDLGDRVFIIGPPGNSSCPAKELPDGCGVSGNSFLFTFSFMTNNVYFFKYGVDIGNAEDNLNWRYSRETRVTILNRSPMLALRVESSTP